MSPHFLALKLLHLYRCLKPFKGSDDKDYAERGGQFYSTDPKCLKGAKQADEAMGMSNTDRLNTFLVELLSTDESEEEEEPAEPMDFDGKENQIELVIVESSRD